uniref:Lectin n=1 Tax=Heterodontus japonicus TaxID=95544 RepID=A0A077JDI1_9CHON|nr:lectin [Heterodontus japonicus]
MELETENNLDQDLEKRESMEKFCANGKQWKHYCYQVFNEPQSWPEAEAYCKKVVPGGHLVSIHGKEQNMFIAEMFGTQIWIGFNDRQTEGDFIWTDNSSIKYVNWNDGEPNNSGDEDCAEMQVSGGWNDLPCSSIKLAFVCQSMHCCI